MLYTPSTSRVAIATVFATTTSEMLVRPCSDVSSAATLRCAGTGLGIAPAVVVLSASDMVTVSVPSRWCLPDSPVAVAVSAPDISSTSGPRKDSRVGVPVRSVWDRDEDSGSTSDQRANHG
jgi:hypothetical protein